MRLIALGGKTRMCGAGSRSFEVDGQTERAGGGMSPNFSTNTKACAFSENVETIPNRTAPNRNQGIGSAKPWDVTTGGPGGELRPPTPVNDGSRSSNKSPICFFETVTLISGNTNPLSAPNCPAVCHTSNRQARTCQRSASAGKCPVWGLWKEIYDKFPRGHGEFSASFPRLWKTF